MTTWAIQGIMNGGLKFIGVYVRDQRFVVLERLDDARLGVTIQASPGFVGKKYRIRPRVSGYQCQNEEQNGHPRTLHYSLHVVPPLIQGTELNHGQTRISAYVS